jgi:hypothetical protein
MEIKIKLNHVPLVNSYRLLSYMAPHHAHGEESLQSKKKSFYRRQMRAIRIAKFRILWEYTQDPLRNS